MTMNDRPYFLPGCHPVELGKYVVITPPIFRLFQSLCRWMLGLKSGCIVYGQSRIGKTRSIRALTTLLQSKFDGLSIEVHNMKEHQVRTEKEFLRGILRSFAHEEANKGNAGHKFDVIVDYLVEQAFKNSQKRLLLFVDEAQWINAIEYGYLRGIYNDIEDRGVVPTFVLVGDTNLLGEYETYERLNNSEITGRFMNEVYEFNGLKEEEEVQFVLNGYDITESNSGWSFTRYFFPTAFENGWRLSSQAEIFWNTYEEIVSDVQKLHPHGIPMSHLAPAVQYFLTTFSDLEIKSPVISRDAWAEAIDFAMRPAKRQRNVKKKNS